MASWIGGYGNVEFVLVMVSLVLICVLLETVLF